MLNYEFDQDSRNTISKIAERFRVNVKGKRPDLSSYNPKHSGRSGHWLESQMGLTINANNAPDFDGFEMKKGNSSKTTFGDWSASYYIFRDPSFRLSRDGFLEIFGKPNEKKNGRYSWSGQPCPKIDGWNLFGQRLAVDSSNNIFAVYSFGEDARENKSEIIPASWQQGSLVLASWDAISIAEKLERKFNVKGWFMCIQDQQGMYKKIVFGRPINYPAWIEFVKRGIVFFDSGMYQGNARFYSQWRANKDFWSSLIVEEYS